MEAVSLFYRDQLVDLFIQNPIAEGLSANELGLVTKHMRMDEFACGHVLFREGDPGEHLYFIIDGKIDIYKTTRDMTDEVRIATLTKGRTLGEMALIDHAPRSASARVTQKAILVSLSRNGFETLLEKHPKIGVKILKRLAMLLSQTLRKTSSQLADHLQPDGSMG